MKWENELTDALKIRYPIVQAPMLGVTTPEMVASISNRGGLGSLPVGGLSPENTIDLIRRTKKLTTAPFAVNLFSDRVQKKSVNLLLEPMQDLLTQICLENGFSPARQPFEPAKFYSYADQIECLLNEHIPVVSFTFGVLESEFITAFKKQGTVLIGTATCLKEAGILDRAGIDIITAQGIEAGGHRGTFLEDEPLPMIGLMALIPPLVANIQKPIIAAGGIHDGRSIKAAQILGAKGVQLGTAFIASEESAAIPTYKEALRHAMDTDTVLTKAISGRWARGLKNKFIAKVEESGIEIPAYPIQGSLTSSIRMESQKQNNKEFTSLWAGQSASKSAMKPAAEIFLQLIKETEEAV